MGYFLKNVEVRIARYGELLPNSFKTDVYVDPAGRRGERYAYGEAYEDSTGTMYLREKERLAWYQLIIYPEDTSKFPGHKYTFEEMKLEHGKKVARAEDNLRVAENRLRKLLE